MARREAKAPILIVLHQEHSTPGRVGRLLAERGHRLDIRRPRFGDPLPETLAEHAGAVIFGGPMSANDPDDFIKTEIDWIGVPLRGKSHSSDSASALRCWPDTWEPGSGSIRKATPRSVIILWYPPKPGNA